MTKHLKHMAIGGAVILAALLVFGMPLATALQYAVLLSCPLMMIGMMLFMNHGSGQGTCHHDHSAHSPEPTASEAPPSQSSHGR